MRELLKTCFKRLLRKGVCIELDERYTYPCSRDFVMADEAVIKTAIAAWFAKENETVEFIPGEKPLAFLLNDKDKYTVSLVLGRSRFNQGYYIHCVQVVE